MSRIKSAAILQSILMFIVCSKAWGQAAPSQIPHSRHYITAPISFEPNQGQFEPRVRFAAHSEGALILLTDDGVEIVTSEPASSVARRVLKLKLVGLDGDTRIAGSEKLPGKVNYLVGNDPSRWVRGVETYRRVQYTSSSGGLGLIFYGNDQHTLEYDLVVPPGVDAGKVRIRVEGADGIAVNKHGDLKMTVGALTIRQRKPVAYSRDEQGVRQDVKVEYAMLSSTDIGFRLGKYDRHNQLIIDPVLVYSSYLGGSANGDEGARGIALDTLGNTYVTGTTSSTTFPSSAGSVQPKCLISPFNPALCAIRMAYVTKINAAGDSILYSTYLGGAAAIDGPTAGNTNATDLANGAIAVGPDGSAYIVGDTQATDFPTTPICIGTVCSGNAAFDNTFPDGFPGFLVKLSPDGSTLDYSTFVVFGPSRPSTATNGVIVNLVPRAIALDALGTAYISGRTLFLDDQGNIERRAFAAKFDPAQSGTLSLIWSKVFGGTGAGSDGAEGIAVDSLGNAYVGGTTTSTTFATTTVPQPTFQITAPLCIASGCGFVTKLGPDGSILYSTFLGGSGLGDAVSGIVVDSAGSATVTGTTRSADFPTGFPLTNAFQSRCGSQGVSAAFVTQLNPSGSQPNWSTCLGGATGPQQAFAIATDPTGNVYVTGFTQASDFPVLGRALPNNCSQQTSGCGGDVFVTAFSAMGSLIYSALVGGSTSSQIGFGIAADPQGGVYVAGRTFATDFPTVTPFQPNSQSVAAGFVLKINRGATVTTVTSSPNPSTVGSLVTFTATVSSTLGAPTGTVSFSDGATSLGSPSLAGSTASIQTSQLAAGTHTITATYSGDPDFAPGSGTVSQVVNAAVSSTTTTITAAPNPAQINQLVFFTISITSAGANTPTGSFELRDGPDLLAIEPIVPGVPTVITSAFGGAGTHSYTAKYLGDPFNAPSQSAPVIVTVLAIATNTTVTGIPNPSVTGQPVVFSARVASATGNPAGNVTFFDSANILGTSAVDAAGNTQFTTSSLGAGVHVITASYDPAPGFASSNSAPWNQTVAQDGIGIIITVAGTGDTTFSGDGGIGTSASIFNPRDLATDSAGNVFIADLGNQRIRRLDATTNLITTVAGNGIAGFSGDGGPATSATLNGPASLAVDAAGSLLFSDLRNQRIRRVDALAGTINTVAGNGTIGLTGDGGLATAATLNDPAGIALDAAGNLFFADADNNVVRRVDGSTGVITTVAGNGLQGATGDGGAATNAALNSPIGVALDANRNLFFVESGNNRIRRVDASSGVISTVAGTGAPGFSGDGGPATSATLSSPIGLAIDAAGNLYVGEQTNARVRRVDASNGTITTVAGNGVQGFAGDGGFATAANLNSPLGVAVDLAGNLYIADKLNNRVRRVRLGFTANTPVGTNLSLVSNGIPFTFANVTSAGSTTVTPISPGSVGPLPPGFSLSGALAFEIHSTATFTGPVTITFVVPRPISAADFGNLQVLHELSTGFEVLPATRNFAALTITATTTSFSPFVVAQSTDVTPPFISCGTPDGLWHANDVTIACTAADSGSGLANAADASFTLSTSVPAGTETANASTNSRTVCDQAGNCAIAGPISGIKVDKKPPAITLTNPAANSSFIVNQSVLASYACADGGSGVASCSGPVASSSAVPTAAAGLFTFTVNATDAVGNASSKSANYGVSYNICLLFDPTKARSVGSKYHFQIQLCDVANRNVSSNSIVVTAISITATGTSALLPLDASDDPDPADLNFNFKPSLGQTGGYEFNLDTNGYRKGTFVLTFKAGADPATHTITFQLR